MPEGEADVIMLEQLETSRMTSKSAHFMAISPPSDEVVARAQRTSNLRSSKE